MARLFVLPQVDGDAPFELDDHFVLVGRETDSLLQIEDKNISKHHALLLKVDDTYRLFDLHSSNGTFVNEERITAATLKEGDVVQFGSAQFRFESGPARRKVGLRAGGLGAKPLGGAPAVPLPPPPPAAPPVPATPLPAKPLTTPAPAAPPAAPAPPATVADPNKIKVNIPRRAIPLTGTATPAPKVADAKETQDAAPLVPAAPAAAKTPVPPPIPVAPPPPPPPAPAAPVAAPPPPVVAEPATAAAEANKPRRLGLGAKPAGGGEVRLKLKR